MRSQSQDKSGLAFKGGRLEQNDGNPAGAMMKKNPVNIKNQANQKKGAGGNLAVKLPRTGID